MQKFKFDRAKFLEKWNSKEEICPNCGSAKPSEGISRQKIIKMFKMDAKRLFWVILLALLLLALFHDLYACRKMTIQMNNNPAEFCNALLRTYHSLQDIQNATRNPLNLSLPLS
jgi:hypothetical protein